MKKIILSCLMLIALNISAVEWESNWIAALEHSHSCNYDSAEQLFCAAIDVLESNNDLAHPSVYVDRAGLYLRMDKNENALADVNKALSCTHLKHKERLKAVSTRVAALLNLGLSDGLEEDVEFLAGNFEVRMENADSYVIIRNMPDSRAFKESLVNYFMHAGLCHSEEDFKIISPDICIVKKTAYRPADAPEGATCPCKGSSNKQLGRTNLVLQGCRNWCDDNAISAIAWCSNYPTLCLINACNSAVLEIQTNCRNCCLNGFSQDFCAAPFGDIVAYMQKYLPPCGGCRALALTLEQEND